jgi:hypothetical protein
MIDEELKKWLFFKIYLLKKALILKAFFF